MYCNLGEDITSQFQTFSVELGQREWYLLPYEIQRLYCIVIANAQHPTNVRGYGNLLCTRDAVKRVSVRPREKKIREIMIIVLINFYVSGGTNWFLLLYDSSSIDLSRFYFKIMVVKIKKSDISTFSSTQFKIQPIFI